MAIIDKKQFILEQRAKGISDEAIFDQLVKKTGEIGLPESTGESVIGKALLGTAGLPTKEVATGLAKGIGSTAFGIAKIGEKIADITGINALLGSIGEKLGIPREEAEARIGEKPEFLKPKTTAEKIGFGAEQIGEFFIPVGGAAKGVSALAKIAPKAPKIAKLGVEAIGEAAEFFAKSAAQTGDLEAATEAGIISGLMPPAIKVAGKVTAPVKRFLSEKLAPRIVNSLIRPSLKEFNFARNPGKGIVEEGITANTRGGLSEAITTKKKEVGTKIGEALTTKEAAKQVIDVEPLLAPLDEAITKAASRGEQELVNRLTNLRNGLTTEFETVVTRTKVGTKEVRAVPKRQKNLQMTPEEARKFKTELGEGTRWTGQAFDNDVNRVKVAIYRNLDEAIDKAVPGVQNLNRRYANLLSAEKSIEKEILNVEKQRLTGLIPAGVGIGFGLGSAVASGDVDATDALVGIAASLGYKAAGSAAVKTRIANALGKLSPEEQGVLIGTLNLVRNFLLGTQTSQSEE